MIVHSNEMLSEQKNMRDGNGLCAVMNIIPSNEVPHGRLFSKITIEKGCSIGAHDHVDETEYYWILRGEGIVTEIDGEKVVTAGDLVIPGGGASHAIRNEKDEPLEFMALILFD